MSADAAAGVEEAAADDAADEVDLAARVAVLEEENRRLREEYARARTNRYRRTALGLLVVGLVGLGGAVAFPDVRVVLLALGATGVFAGLLTYYLTPERFLPAGVTGAVYDAVATNADAIVAELGLRDDRIYVPGTGADVDVRLFVPQHPDYALPDEDELSSTFVVADDERRRGLALSPTGGLLFHEFEHQLAGPLAADPVGLADQLADGLVEGLELADGATPDVDAADGRASIGITAPAHGSVARFDHPVASFLGVGFAAGLDRPVAVETTAADDRYDAVVTCRWSADG